MIQDPVTGMINVNVKHTKVKKSLKVSRPNKFLDLRPLERFESKLIGKKRLSVVTL
jgi:hypothetical protein